MADDTTNKFKKMLSFFEGIRDERNTAANTASRIGRAFIMLLDYCANGVAGLYLSKTKDDETKHKLTMGEAEVKGALTVGGDISGTTGVRSKNFDGASEDSMEHGKGFGAVEKDGAGKIYTDFLHVRTKAYFEELETRVLSRVGGDYLFTKAGSKIVYVKACNEAGEVITDNSADKKVNAYRCYYLQDDGTTQTMNNWSVGDFARCEVTNIKQGVSQHASNRYYTRLVLAVSDAPKPIDAFGNEETKKYGWVDLAANEENKVTAVGSDGKNYTYTCEDSIDLRGGSDVPMAEDAIVQVGNFFAQDTGENSHTKGAFKERGNVLLLSATHGGIYVYNGINVPEKDKMIDFQSQQIDTDRVRFRSDRFQIAPWAAPNDSATLFCLRGDYSAEATYGKGDVVLYGGQLWCCTSDEPITGKAPTLLPDKDNGNKVYWAVYTAKGADGKTQVYTIEAVSRNYDLPADSDGNRTPSTISCNGTVLDTDGARGLRCYFLRGTETPSIALMKDYDTYETPDKATEICDFLTGTEAESYRDCVLVILGWDALSVNGWLRNALKTYGYGGDDMLYDTETTRTSFVFIGQRDMVPGTAIYQMSKDEVRLSASVVGGVLTGKGQRGADGKDGTQHKLVEEYAYGDSNTIAPTEGWSGDISGGAQGRYLWNRETAMHKGPGDENWMTDGLPTYHCMGYIANDGDNGAGITGIEEWYLAKSNSTPPELPSDPSTGDNTWEKSPTDAGWSEKNAYLWNYEIIKRDKGGDLTTNVHLDGVWGKRGADGAYIKNYYARGTSATSLKDAGISELQWKPDGVTPDFQKNIDNGWSDTAPEPYPPTGQTYIWQASYRAQGSLCKRASPSEEVSYVCLTGEKGDTGAAGYSYAFSVAKKELLVKLPADTPGAISSGGFTLSWNIDMTLYKMTANGTVSKYKSATLTAHWVTMGGTETTTTPPGVAIASNDKAHISGQGTQHYDITDANRIVGMMIKATVGGKVIAQQYVDVTIESGSWLSKTNEVISMGVTNGKSISDISAKADSISQKVQDLATGGVDTSKPHTSSQVDFRTLNDQNYYPVLIKLPQDGKRHTIEVNRPFSSDYGAPSGISSSSSGFSFRMVFSDVASGWGAYQDGVEIESVVQKYTYNDELTCICPRVEQYTQGSMEIVWLRGGSKYDITVDTVNASISDIWPYMMQIEGKTTWVPDYVKIGNGVWTTAQINADAKNHYNMFYNDDDGKGFYQLRASGHEYLFGELKAGNTIALVGQPTDSRQWFIVSVHIKSVSGSKIYINTDDGSYGLKWTSQCPIGINEMAIAYISKDHKLSKDSWTAKGFGTTKDVSDSDVFCGWTLGFLLYMGTETETTNVRATLDYVSSYSKGSYVNLSAAEGSTIPSTHFDVSPLYGTDGRRNVKTDLLATGIDIKSHKITATTDNFEVRNNNGTTTFTIDKDGNIVGGNNAMFKGGVTASVFSLTSDIFVVNSDGTFKLDMTNFKVDANGNITAKGGAISFIKFDEAGLSGGVQTYGTQTFCTGFSLTSTSLAIGSTAGGFLSNVFLGNGRSDFRTTMKGLTVKRVDGHTDSNFYNYIRLTNTGASPVSTRNEDAALGVETDGNFCITALGGPSSFQGLCLPSHDGSSITADGRRTMYRCSGGTFRLPSNPPDDMVIIVIQTTVNGITFDGNGHNLCSGNNTTSKANSSTNGQWTVFCFNGTEWDTAYFNGRPW